MKRWLKRGLLVVVVTILCVAIAVWIYTPPQAVVDRETYAALSAYITSGLTGDSHDFGSRHGLVIIYGRTSNGMFWVLPPEWPHFATRSMRFISTLRSLASSKFEAKFDLPARYRFTNDRSFLESDVSPAEQRQGYGIMTFSKVTFNHNATQALFYTEHLCGLCGGAEFVLMEKRGGKWVVVNEQGTWVS